MTAPVQRFERNLTGRDLIVGDIHGSFSRLLDALKEIDFRPEQGDRLFSVGDLVDRGPESPDSLLWLAQPFFHAVQGNHEDMAIRWPNGQMPSGNYVGNGGGWNVKNSLTEQLRFADAFAALPVAIELQTTCGLLGIVHASCPLSSWGDFVAALEDPNLSRRERERLIDEAQWSRSRIERMETDDVEGVRAVVVGHTPVPSMTSLGNVLYIDTGGWLPAHRDGHFTLLNAETLQPERTRLASNDAQGRVAA